MLKTLLATTAVSALMVTGALAQTTPAPAPATPPAATDSAKPADKAASFSDPKFIAAQTSDQMVFSKFKGTDVLGPDNAHIGDVSDFLFDKNGKVLAYVVGVGGFLGIGEKNVAIEPTAFQMAPAENSSDPSDMKLKVSWTKDQLKNAPAFEYYKAPARTTGTGTGGGTTGSAPRPSAPAAPR